MEFLLGYLVANLFTALVIGYFEEYDLSFESFLWIAVMTLALPVVMVWGSLKEDED